VEVVGSQVKLPLSRAFQIALQGIRIRIGRSLVTVSGVVLGIAFLMSNLTAQFIRTAVAQERERRRTVNLMETMIRGEIGSLDGKRLGVAVFGAPGEAERALLERLAREPLAELRVSGLALPGRPAVEPERAADGMPLLLVLGDASASPRALPALTRGMSAPVVLDAMAGRVYPGGPAPGVRRELFFGRESEEQLQRLQEAARQARFRTLWIAVISVLVTVIGIANALLMSVTERFREIGTMKCLGALSGFIRRLFLLESAMIGLAGSILGAALGAAIPLIVYGLTYGFGPVLGALAYGRLGAAAAACVGGGTLMAMVAALYPAGFASRMVPAAALRSNI
jgi:hypothetical protein